MFFLVVGLVFWSLGLFSSSPAIKTCSLTLSPFCFSFNLKEVLMVQLQFHGISVLLL